ncbi:MAG: phage tail protein [Oligoflexus sp.]
MTKKTLIQFSNEDEIERLADLAYMLKLGEGKFEMALRRATNKTLRSYVTFISRDVAKRARVKMKLIKRRMKFYPAGKRHSAAYLSLIANALPTIILDPKPSRRGVRVFGGRRYERGFVARSSVREREAVFERYSEQRLPLDEKYVEVESHVGQVYSGIDKQILQKFLKNFEHEIKYRGGLFG